MAHLWLLAKAGEAVAGGPVSIFIMLGEPNG